MTDYGAEYTDKAIKDLDQQLKTVYKEAQNDIEKKMDEFTKKYEAKEKKYAKDVASGKMTQAEFDKWKQGQVFQGKQWQAKKEDIATVLYNSNKIASSIINQTQIPVFATNNNYGSYQMEHDAGVNFGFFLYDQNTVMMLIKDEPNLLPNYVPKKSKDMNWNTKKITRQITQGIIQGESLDRISKRLALVTASQNMNSMKTHARTLMTGAQNAGRLNSYKNAQKIGIELQKEWMATLDPHTRDSHVDLDGERVDVDKKFSNGLMYPGEAGGPPEEVYNCFIPETNIASDSEIIRSYKHYYSGKLVSIKSARGVNFSCTPNHPILTDRGWIAAGSLNNGDHLIVTFRKNDIFARINPNINHRLTRMDTIHEFFDKFGAKRTCSLGVNFHGDIPASDVEIVTKKRFLRSIKNISFIKSINKFLLKFTDTALMCKSSFMEHFRGIVRSSFSNIGSISKPFSFISRSLCHSNIHRFRVVSDVNLSISEYPVNNLPTDPNFFGESLIGLTGKIFLDDIISVDVSDFTGHVYNLQTKNNYYFVNNNTNNTKLYNGIFAIAHNCRCTMVSDIKKYPSSYNRYDNIDGKQIKNMSYKEWENAKKQGLDLSPTPLTFKHFKTDEQKALMDLFSDKTMTGLYKEIKAFDKTAANQFFGTLSKEGKPSQVWTQYLNGTLNEDASKKIDDILNKYGLDSGIIAQPVDLKLTFADVKMSHVYNDMKTIDPKMANAFYKDLSTMTEGDKASAVWQKYLDGQLSDKDAAKIEKSLEKYLNAQSSQMTIPKDASQVLAAQKPKDIKTLEDAQKALKSAEDAVKKAGADKEFVGIWQDPVTYADYEAKKDSIQAKKDYYNDKIATWQKKLNEHDGAEKWYMKSIEEAKDNLKQLEEFEKNGKAYSQLFKNVEDAKAKVKSFTPTAPALSQERKDAALWAKSPKEADAALRTKTGEVWQKATTTERAAAYDYTMSYHKFNEPLRGYEYGSNVYKGVGKTDLNAGYQDNGNKLNAMTKLIDKCSYDHDMWLQRGVGFDGMDKFLDIDMDKLRYGTEKELQKELLGKTVTEYGFMSCGSSKGKGFSGDILFNVYAPSGTKMMYVEPFSYYGEGSGKSWDGKASQPSFGRELETILQQGTQFNITKLEKKGHQIYIDLEVTNQLPPQLYKK